MPGAGTDKTKRWIETPAPVVVLVEPQLGENIGATARAMANFGLPRLRLVKPLQRWPNERARVMAAGADRILDGVVLYDSLNDAIGDCNFVLATTARNHDQAMAFGFKGTPSFIVGKFRVPGILTMAEFEMVIADARKAKKTN